MAQSLSKILLHIVFSTKYRAKLIVPECEQRLHAYMATTCRALGSQAFRVGGTSDHVHIACSLPRTVTVARLVEKIKGSSSRWVKQEFPRCSQFRWQTGYGVFSLGQSQLKHIVKYIEGQKAHHRQVALRDEVIGLLERYGVEYDEHYLWD